MSRQALKNVLLDLKKQMRGKRASTYIKKVSDVEPVKGIAEPSKKEPADSDVMELAGDTKGKSALPKEVADKPEGPVDFADEMKKFFKKQNTGKKREAPSAFASFAADSGTPPKASPAPKKKGK